MRSGTFIARKGAAAAAVTLLIATAMLLGPAGAANAAMHTYDGTDPNQTSCVNDAQTLPGYPKAIWGGSNGTTQVGTYEVRYSPSCGTNWLRVNNWYSSGQALVRMIFGVPGTSAAYITDETASGSMWTPQVYAPGSTCVGYEVFVTTNGEPYSQLGYINPGLPGTYMLGSWVNKQC